jgi:hypothetical protein
VSTNTVPFWLSEKLRLLPLEWVQARVVPGECDCWLWCGAVNKGRLTAILTSGRGRQHAFDARRLVYRLVHGRTPGRKFSPRCLHHEHCVNPEHLVLRPVSPVHVSEALWRDAISHARRKASLVMTPAKAQEIRQSTEPLRVIAGRVGCSVTLASLIRRGLAWAEPSPWRGLMS